MPETIQTKVLIIGGGMGGYVCAIRLGQLGIEHTLVEADRLGGTCLIRGCIPSKALIHAATKFETVRDAASEAGTLGVRAAQPSIDLSQTVAWKDGVVARLNGGVTGLLKRAKTRVLKGWAEFSDAKTATVRGEDGSETVIRADTVVLAAGSTSVELPFLPFGGNVISSTEALSLDRVPAKLVVVGAGYIGLELGICLNKMGANVTVVEAQDRILPLYDKALTDPVRKWCEKHGMTLHLSARAKGLEGDQFVFTDKDGAEQRVPADKVLVTVGRKPLTQGWGLEKMGVDMAGPFVKVDDRLRTSMKGVYAVGDLIGEPMLAHKSAAQGEMVAELIAGKDRRWDPVAISAVCFTEPEIVSAGLTPLDVEGRDDVIQAVFPLQAIGRALAIEADQDGGFARVIARKDDHRLLGIQIVGRHVSELSNEFAMALEMGAVLEDVAGIIHVHPTLGEAFHESALRALGHAIHV